MLKLIFSFLLFSGFLIHTTYQSPVKECGTSTSMVKIPTGEHIPFMSEKDTVLKISAFQLDKYPVTNKQFQEFIQFNSKWEKGNRKTIFADEGYLKHWNEKLNPDQENSPVTNISWYAARAYCECRGKRLPDMYEWEYAGSAPLLTEESDEIMEPDKVVLQWYSSPSVKILPPVGSTYMNEFDVYDMHGLIWEWVEDFNSVMLPRDNRNKKELEQLYCGSGALGSADPSDYASFLRYGLRSSLKANYTLQNLGFRCAKDINHE